MTNEEKARELAHFILYDKSYESMDRNIYDKCIEMAKWKEKQTIEKACEWLEPIFKDLVGYNCGGDLINAFKKVMME